jgi:transposase
MKRFIEGEDRTQVSLLPPCLEDYVEAENPVRVVEVFVDGLDLDGLGFGGVDPAATGRPGYYPAVLLKLYIYGYLNRIQSSRRLEREAQRNVELMWLTGRLMPDFKTIANFRKDNGPTSTGRHSFSAGRPGSGCVEARPSRRAEWLTSSPMSSLPARTQPGRRSGRSEILSPASGERSAGPI